MCGISGFFLRDPDFRVNQNALLDTLLLGIEERGKHATGFVAIGGEGTLEWQKASCDASTFVKNRRLIPDGARGVIGHTRWATQGLPSFMENNHPIKRGPFYIIHNGHVHNDEALLKEAERDRFGEVDSEAIAARLSYYGDLKYLGNVIEEIDGDAAVAAVDERNPGRFVLARGAGSPMHVYNGKRIVIFASTEATVKKAYEKHVGRLGKDQTIWVREGTMLFWNGDNEYWTKELILPKVKYSWQSDWDDDKEWTSIYTPTGSSTTTTSATTEEDKRAERITEAVNNYINRERLRRFGFADDDYDDDKGWTLYEEVACDNCSKTVQWDDTFDYYDLDTKYTFSLCPECYEYYNHGEGADDGSSPSLLMLEAGDDVIDGEVIDLDYDESLIDDYCGANSAVLRMLDEDDQQGSSESALLRAIDRIRSVI